MSQQSDDPDREDEVLQPLDVVLYRTSHKRSTLYMLIAGGRFPRPIKIGARRVAWRKSEIDAWIAKTIARDRA